MGAIERGLCVLVGVTADDTEEDLEYVARKIANTRLWDDAQGRPNGASVVQAGLEVLCVSQFTLYAKLKGNKPDYHLAAPGPVARPMYERLVAAVRQSVGADRVKEGVFGAMMVVDLANDGPVTIIVDSNARDPGRFCVVVFFFMCHNLAHWYWLLLRSCEARQGDEGRH
jgi:D-tyrosyl-tRNA(Tyr) deacylase